jgi:hypothetical protein
LLLHVTEICYKQQKVQLFTHLEKSIIDDDTANAITIMLNYDPTLPHSPPPRAIPDVIVRAHYTLPGGLGIVAAVHQRRHRPPPPPSSPSRGWLLLGDTCRHHHSHHCRPPPTQPHQHRRLCCLASSSSPPATPPPPRRRRALSALSITHGAIMDRHAALMPSLPVRLGKYYSRTCPPRRDTGPLRQRRRHSSAAGGIPSFASRAATAGLRVMATAARRC